MSGNRTRIVAWFLLIGVAVGTVPLGIRLMDARGPHWLGHNNDPHYHYLVNALHVARLKSPGHVDHPGTTIQLIGAGVIRITHLLSGKSDLTRDVLERPEHYTNMISYTLLAIHALIVLAAGVIAFKATGNIFLALIIQIGPHVSTSCLDSLTRPKPESLLLSLSCLFGATVLAFLWNRDSSREVRFAIIFGILVGLALVTKITAAPLAIMPLLILGEGRSRATYVGVTAISFVVAALPVILAGRLTSFFGFLFQISTHTGFYGGGADGFIEFSSYLTALNDLSRYERILFLAVLYTAGLLVWDQVTAERAGVSSGRSRSLRRGLFALLVVQVVQVLMVAKHPQYHYLVPSLGMLGLSGALVAGILLERRGEKATTSGAALFLTICFITVAFQAPRLVGLVKMLDRCRETQLTVVLSLEQYKDWTHVCSFGASTIPLGLVSANSILEDEYGALLKKLYPDFIPYPNGISDANPHILLRGSRLSVDESKIKDRLQEVYSGLSPEDRTWANQHGMERLYRLRKNSE